MQKTLQSICIVGGGTAGWMAACLLGSTLKGSRIEISLIESPDIDTIGVGESTVPSIIDFIRACHIDLKEFVKATSASFKLGIRFDDWLARKGNYFHPFGRIGQDINGFDFYQAWLKTQQQGQPTPWVEHAPSAVMAENERFILRPQQAKNWVEHSFAHALHLDALQVARYLRKLALKRGVKRYEASVSKVILDPNGHVNRLEFSEGGTLAAGFFIDCTGFGSLLSQGALEVSYEDWSAYLPCDRAVTVQTENQGAPLPYTIASAKESGWMWHIPLQHRSGNGYVFSSAHCSDDRARRTLLDSVKGKLLNEPRFIPFLTGKRRKIWHNNCLALGLAAGFIEPLESTAIHLVYKTLIYFIQHFPDRDIDERNIQAFNEKIDTDYREIRDFIILHYCISDRADSNFWHDCQDISVPDSLREKINAFKYRGQIMHRADQLFTRDSWCSIFEGMQIRPNKYHPLLDSFSAEGLAKMMADSANNTRNIVMQMPKHGDFIQQNCAA